MVNKFMHFIKRLNKLEKAGFYKRYGSFEKLQNFSSTSLKLRLLGQKKTQGYGA